MEVEPCMSEFQEYEPSEEAMRNFVDGSVEANVFNRMGFRFECIYCALHKGKDPRLDRFYEAASNEFITTFFTTDPIDSVHEELRVELANLPSVLPTEIKGKSYQEFSTWIDNYVSMKSTHTERNVQMKLLYFTKFHHSRLSHGSLHHTKLHTLLFIETNGTSNIHKTIHSICPIRVVYNHQGRVAPTKEKSYDYNQGKVVSFMVWTQQEIDNVKNNFKERFTSGVNTKFFEDQKVSPEKARNLKMSITNSRMEDFEDHLSTHYILLPLPPPKPSDKIGNLPKSGDQRKVDHMMVHLLYYLMDMALQSGVNGSCRYGMDMKVVSETLSERYIPWDVPEKQNRVYELVRCIAISYTAWCFAQMLTGEMRLNSSSLREALSKVKVTKEMVEEALLLLGF